MGDPIRRRLPGALVKNDTEVIVASSRAENGLTTVSISRNAENVCIEPPAPSPR
jgi:hypothetical protein